MKDGAGVPEDVGGRLAELAAVRARLGVEFDAEVAAGAFDRDALVPDTVVDGLRDAAAVDLAGFADSELVRLVGRAEAARRAVDATIIHAVGELDRRGATGREFGLTAGSWLAAEHRLPRADAQGTARCGGFLRNHAIVDAALADGRISGAHVRTLQRLCTPRVAEVVAAIQQQLVDLAVEVRFEPWRSHVRALLELADPDGGHDARPDDNRLAVGEGLDGVVHLQGQLVGEWAVEFTAMLEAETDRLFREHRNDADVSGGELAVPDRAVLRALALVELARKGRAAGRSASAPVADVTLVVRTPADLPDRLRQPSDGQSDGDWLAGLLVTTLAGMPVQRSVARLLLCDPLLRVHVEDHQGVPLSHGRERRLPSRAQRRAAAIRWGGCCFPGCDAPPSWVDLHHAREWHADHGPTDHDNLLPLCRRHHGVVHRHGWDIHPTADGFEVTTPTGRAIPCEAHGRPPPRAG